MSSGAAAKNISTPEHVTFEQNGHALNMIMPPKLPNAKTAKEVPTAKEFTFQPLGPALTMNEEPKMSSAKTAKDVPTAKNFTFQPLGPALTIDEEPKLPSAEVETEPLFVLTEKEIARLTRATGVPLKKAESGTVIKANALEKVEAPPKQIPQTPNTFTKSHKSRKVTAKDFDPDYDVSDSSVCSDTELSIDNHTPRALRRPLGQEGIESRRHSTATDVSVAKVEKWIHRTRTYHDMETQTEDFGVQTDNTSLVKDMGLQKKSTVLMDMGVQTDDVPVKMPNGEDLGLQTKSKVLVEDIGVQTEDVSVKMPNGTDVGVKNDQEPKMKNASESKMKETRNFRQSRGYILFTSFSHLLLLLFYLGMCYITVSLMAATTAERDLWTSTNSAVTHNRLLFENTSNHPISAIDPMFYRKL